MMYTIGIDLGGTNIVAGVVDEQYHILATAKCKSQAQRTSEEIVDDMVYCAWRLSSFRGDYDNDKYRAYRNGKK